MIVIIVLTLITRVVLADKSVFDGILERYPIKKDHQYEEYEIIEYLYERNREMTPIEVMVSSPEQFIALSRNLNRRLSADYGEEFYTNIYPITIYASGSIKCHVSLDLYNYESEQGRPSSHSLTVCKFLFLLTQMAESSGGEREAKVALQFAGSQELRECRSECNGFVTLIERAAERLSKAHDIT